MYEPKVARFMSRDPLREDGVDLLYPPPQIDPYRYVRNDPINAVDPSGLKPVADSLVCPLVCAGPKCFFELELFRDVRVAAGRGRQGVSERVVVVSMRFKPKVPTALAELAIKACGPVACYGGYDRDVGKDDFITYVLKSGEVCKMTRASFPKLSPYPLPPGETNLTDSCYLAIGNFGSPQDTAWDGAEYVFAIRNIKSIEAKFTIKNECICGIGHLDIPGVPEEFRYSTTTGTISINEKLTF